MRNGVVLAGVVFGVTLAVLVVQRLSDAALAVAVGVVCGLSASLPVSLALMIAVSHHWGRERESYREIGFDYESRRYAPHPPVVILASPQSQMPYGASQDGILSLSKEQYEWPPHAPAPGTPRQFKIVGDE